MKLAVKFRIALREAGYRQLRCEDHLDFFRMAEKKFIEIILYRETAQYSLKSR